MSYEGGLRAGIVAGQTVGTTVGAGGGGDIWVFLVPCFVYISSLSSFFWPSR